MAGQDKPTAAETRALRDRIAALGQNLGPDMIAAAVGMFGGDHPKSLPQGIKVERDLEYGPDERHRLDIFAPAGGASTARPVLLFVHGGGFTGGDKRLEGLPFYDNVGQWAVENGFVGATMTYRLAPGHQWPAAVEDVARAVAWVRREIADRGGDPDRIFLMGHSAGAVHAASYVARQEFQPAEGSGIAGAILVAGLYNLATAEHNAILESYFGSDPSRYAERSSVPQIREVPIPALVAVGEFDPPDFGRQAIEMAAALFERDGRAPRFVRLHGHNHYTEIMAFNLPYSAELARQIVDFVNIDCSASH